MNNFEHIHVQNYVGLVYDWGLREVLQATYTY